VILLAQGWAVWSYELLTARHHELPWPLPNLLGLLPQAWGLEAAIDGHVLAIRSGDEVFRIAATWELLFDPATLCFLIGGSVFLGLMCREMAPRGARLRTWLRDVRTLLGLTLLWLPLRAGVLVALVLHRALRADLVGAPNVADVFVNSWLHVALLGGLLILVLRRWWRDTMPPLVVECGSQAHAEPIQTRAAVAYVLLGALGFALLVGLYHWEPVGQRQAGRVMVVEKHSTWEPTTEPYGTKGYGEKGSYNYAAMYDYCGQYFSMSRLLEADAIDDQTLQRCDVLVIKTPTARYSADEIAAVVRFVDQGGALLLVGDHTNVFNMSTCLNDLARQFGFSYRNDLLFRVGTPYTQLYVPPVVAHPLVQHMPRMNFAVSCSIDPGRSAGRMVIRSTGLWNLPPAYQEMNYHPQAEYRPHMQYGAWCQLWSTCYGRGRVLAFTDSTLFSNFCVFQPGKAELMRGMLEWLNHRSVFDRRGVWCLLVVPWAVAACIALGMGLWRGRRAGVPWLLLLAAGWAGWAVGAGGVIAMHRWSLPVPPAVRPLPHVVIDRTVSEVPLFTGAFTDGEEGVGYGMLEQWIPRLGNFISRRSGAEAFLGDAIVILCPTRSVPTAYRERLVSFVRDGGRLVVFDSPDVEGSTANSLLWPFGLESRHNVTLPSEAKLKLGHGETAASLESSCQIAGGEPLAWLGEVPVAAQVRFGQGAVTAIGFGSLYNDANMGYHWLPEPSLAILQRYETLYALLRASLGGATR
jgi:hypothetical protein